MNDLTTMPTGLTMSSREIAELTGKRHGNVIADIRNMLYRLGYAELKFQSSYRDASGKANIEYLLPKRECLILVSGYSVELRASIIDRWQELEEQARKPQLPDFTNAAEAARAWANEFEGRRLAEAKVEEQAPKVAALDKLKKATGNTSLRETAKLLEIPERVFIQKLHAEGWIFRQTPRSNWQGYSDKVKQGLITHSVYTTQDDNGEERSHSQVKITPKGLAKLAEQITQGTLFGMDGGA